MTKKLLSFFTGLLFSLIAFTQVPAGYYDAASSKTGEVLRAALRDITTTGSVKLPYTSSSFDIWDAYAVTDTRPANSTIIWDMYSDIPSGSPLYNFTIYTQQCGTASVEGDCYSREHQVPNSWWGGLDDAQNPQYTDLHHLPPADQYVNSRKSAHPIGQITSPSWTSSNGSKVGPCSWPGYTGTVFEPIDEYKGDFARAYLYIATRYMNSLSSWVVNYPGTEAQYVINTSGNNYKQWFIDMLIQWCNNDPVSQKEMDRNDAIYYNTPQHNRNPYIDHPEYVCLVWSSSSCVSAPSITSITQNPVSPGSANTVSVTATVTSTNALSSVFLEWGTDGVNFPNTINMNLATGSDYTTASNIPAQPTGTTIYYRVTAQDNLTHSTTSTVHSYTVLKAEPTAYPTNIACGTSTSSSITLTWTDAVGTSVPDGYLVKASNISFAAIADPVDGTVEANGTFIKNVTAGTQQVVFSGLVSSTSYYFKIYPYTNSGTNINYKISPAAPTANCTTAVSTGGACATDLIISEYLEGSGNNKYIELYNGTGANVDLGNYRLRLFSNGASSPTSDILLAGTLNNLATVVYKNSSATIYMGTTITNAAVNFNGDDAIALYKVSTASYVDIFGRIGERPTTAWTSGVFTTIDKTLVRNADITSGISVNPSSGFPTLSTQWTQYNTDVISNLGGHTMTCPTCASPDVPANTIFYTSIGQTSMNINWTNGDGSNRIVVVKDGSAVTGTPVNGIGYNANTVFGSGDILNADEYTVYNNSGSLVSISNLISGHTYYVTVFEYNCVPGSQIYLTPGTSSSAVTYSITTGTVPESQYCITATTGFTTTVDLVATGTLYGGNTYSVQLSDANGSFVSPVEIGTLASTQNNETINCTIPANTPSGTGYLVRVVSNGPIITGSNSNPFEIILSPTAVAPSNVSSDRSGFCSTDPGNITLTATGGSGTILSWDSGTCGGSFIGTGNPLVIASPVSTTTYYARWDNTCSTSPCTSVTVSVSGLPSASAGSSITSCSGMSSIAMTGASSSGGTNTWSGGSGSGTWAQNSNPALATFTPSIPAGSFTATLTVFSTNGCTNISASYTRTISWGTTGMWIGASSTDWFTSANWCGGVPTSTSNITIPATSQVLFSPVISNSFATCQNITLAGSLNFGNGFNLDVNGSWTNNSGSLNNSSGSVTFRGIGKTISGTTATAFPGIKISSGSSYTMNNNNSATSLTLNAGAPSSLTFSNSSMTVNGNVVINNPTSTGTSAWNINNGSATVTGNVTVGNAGSNTTRIAKVAVGSGSLSIGGNLIYSVGSAASGVVDLSGGAATLNLSGTLSLSPVGTLIPGTSSTVNYNGSITSQIVTVGSSIFYYNLTLNNLNAAGAVLGGVINTSNVTGNISVQSGILANGSFTVTGNAVKQFSVSNAALYRLTGNTSMPSGFGTVALGTSSAVDFNGSLTQTIDAYNYGNLTSSNSGARILAGSGIIGVGGVFSPGTNSYTVAGSTVNFNGSNQTIPAFNGLTGYNNLSVSQSSGIALAGGNINIAGTLNLISGNFNIGSSILLLNGSSAVLGSPFSSSKMIIADGGGELRKSFSANGSYLFPVGDNFNTAEYSPVTLNYTSGTYNTGAYSSVKVNNIKHLSNANSNNYLNRYWTIINSGITSPLFNVDATYLPADVTGADANISMGRYTTALPWVKYNAANTGLKTLTATGATNTGTSYFSGISSLGPAITIQGGAVTICNGDIVPLSTTVTGTGPFSYSWSPAGSLNQATIANPSASPVSTTTYTLTVTDANGIIATQNTTITVNQKPSAVISPNGVTTFCDGGSVILTSSASTSYLWSTGATTQAITVAAAGNYSVTVTNSAGCSATSQPTTVTVNNCGITLNLRLFLQSYYTGGGIMQPVLNNEGVPFSLSNETDTIIVELHHATTFGLIASKKAVLLTNGSLTINFTQSPGSYYIAILHRNTVQTWTANPIACSLTTPLYDFSTAASKAYADNQVQVGPGVWAFFTGDLNQDEFIDGNDFPLYDYESISGGLFDGVYTKTDMNGDGFVDGNDFPSYDVNSFNAISSIHP